MSKTTEQMAREAGIVWGGIRGKWTAENYQLKALIQIAREAYRAELLAGSGEPAYSMEFRSGEKLDYYTADQVAAAVLKAQAVPPGYKLVPVEPTEAMQYAGGAAIGGMPSNLQEADAAYRAMLAAAPAPGAST